MLDGVAQVQVTGASKYAVRIQADPNALAARGMGIDTLGGRDQCSEHQPGHRLAQRRQRRPGHSHRRPACRTPRNSASQIIAYSNGAPVRLGDVANVIDSSANIRQADWYRTTRAVSLQVQRQPGANTIEVVRADQGRSCPSSRPVCPPASIWKSAMTAAKPSAPRWTNVQETLLIAAALVVRRDLHFPAQSVGHHHSRAGAAHRGDRHLRRHVADGFQPRQSLADGTDPFGRLCGG